MSTLVFAIGPVQGFISQSRRTADGWVGSYLLSYLAGHALAYLEDQIGERNIIEPALNVPMYEAIKGLNASGTLPERSIPGDTTIAALPNVLVVNVENKNCLQLGEQAKREALAAWKAIHQAIYSKLPDGMKTSSEVTAIWNRQVAHHWEFYWAWGKDSREAFDNLAARKGLRDFEPIEESGDRCTVCAQREALWDKSRRQGRHHQARDTARENWGGNSQDNIRGWIEDLNGRDLGIGRKTPLNLFQPGGKERLCAICLIKRLIPWTPNPVFQTWKAGTTSLQEPSVFPSTSTMATVRYRTKLIEKAGSNKALQRALSQYLLALRRGTPKGKKPYGNPADPLEAFECWQSTSDTARSSFRHPRVCDWLLRMDGDWYLYGEAVKNEEGIRDQLHAEFIKAYRELRRAAREAGVEEAPIYYALLTMDGDQMGEFKEAIVNAWGWPAAREKLKQVSGVLNDFARAVPALVRKHEGRTVYAGGDDVVALFPLETALEAAEVIRTEFYKRFEAWLCCQDSTICKIRNDLLTRTLSASIIYAHHQAPLGRVLHEGHRLLTEWAKKRAGRNALALQQYQRSGPSTTVAAKWDIDGQPLTARLGAILDTLKKGEQQVASRFLYGLEEIAWMFEKGGPFADEQNLDGQAYVKALLLKSRLREGQSEADREEAAARHAREMLTLCRPAVGEKREGFATEPLLIARFLAGGGREER